MYIHIVIYYNMRACEYIIVSADGTKSFEKKRGERGKVSKKEGSMSVLRNSAAIRTARLL